MNIFVGCSSRDTDNKYYNKIAEDVANFIVNSNHNFVFGGCSLGLMGKIYSIVSKNPTSEIIITMAKAYEDELKNLSYNKAYISNTVNERKNCFIELSDIMLFLPGGIGTIDEILTSIETKRSKQHNVPIIIINTNNYFNSLLEMLNKIYDEGFASSDNRKLYFVANSLDEALDYISTTNLKL